MDFAGLSASSLPMSEEGHVIDIPIEPWVVGAIALGILVLLLIALVLFGQGREHT